MSDENLGEEKLKEAKEEKLKVYQEERKSHFRRTMGNTGRGKHARFVVARKAARLRLSKIAKKRLADPFYRQKECLKDKFNIEGRLRPCVISYVSGQSKLTRLMLLDEDVVKAFSDFDLKALDGKKTIQKLLECGAIPQTLKSCSLSDANVLHGKQEEYSKNGRLILRSHYAEGELHGPYKEYHENGELEREGTFKRGKEHGKWSAYYSGGQLDCEGTFMNGKMHGKWTFYYDYYDGGKLEAHGFYDKDKAVGIWEHFYRDGRVKDFSLIQGGNENDQSSFSIQMGF